MTDFRPRGFQVLPVVVKNLIIINVILVFAQYVLGRMNINLGDYLGLHYWQSPKFKWWQIITHMFMHGDPYDLQMTILHIFSNMFALWMFGSTLENLWGPKRFFIFYMVCGIGAAFCHLGVLTFEFTKFHNAFVYYQEHANFIEFAQFARHNNFTVPADFLKYWQDNPGCTDCVPETIKAINEHYTMMINETTVGASGAVFGVLFAFGYLFPNTLLYIYFAIPVKAKYFVGLYAIFELYSGVKNSAGDNVAHFAHLGGMLFAYILLRIWNTRNRNDFY